MILRRTPRPVLRPFVESVWATDETHLQTGGVPSREHVLPTGLMHVVFRLGDDPLRLFRDAEDTTGRIVGDALVGGARASYYIRESAGALYSVGAQLRPGAAQALFGVPADELAEHHTSLGDLWGQPAASIRDRLSDAESSESRLDLLEAILAARLPAVRGLHPAVAGALEQFSQMSSVRDVVRHSGYSHRTLISLFTRSVGLTPKRYCRVLRFRRALERASAGHTALIDLAGEAGYSDQAHFTREFREFAGMTPSEYRRAAPRFPHHVPVGSDQGSDGGQTRVRPGSDQGQTRVRPSDQHQTQIRRSRGVSSLTVV